MGAHAHYDWPWYKDGETLIKRPECETGHEAFSTEVTNAWGLASTHPITLGHRNNFTFTVVRFYNVGACRQQRWTVSL